MRDTEENQVMQIAILVIAILILIVNILTMFMVAALVSKNTEKPKTYEQAQADLFQAWGNSVISEYSDKK